MPANPISGLRDVRVVGWMPGAADGTSGWIWCPWTGDFRANSAGVGPSGTPDFDL